MPHIFLESHKDIECKNSDKFRFIANGKYDQKICAIYDNKEFLLTKVKKKDNYLIKLDQTTRLTPVSMMKDALNDYATLSKAKILASNTHSINNKIEPQKQYLKNIDYFVDQFSTDKEIWVEVGFGSGTHLLHQAINNPDKIIIGLEIHYPSIEQVLKQIKIQNITNILVVDYDARLFLEFLKSNSVGRVFVHFPVPWDKKPHRRVMSIGFIQECMRVLKIDSTLELRTDSPNYFEYSSGLLEHFKEHKHTIKKNQPLQIVSKYEARWKRQEKDIWDITIFANQNSNDVVLNDTFDFNDTYTIKQIEEKLPKQTTITDQFLVQFESIYYYKQDNQDGIIFKVILGSFNRPVAKYIIYENGKLRYFQGDPIKTKINLEAHRKILEILK
jgi:tRNA (guanine-N7-)-methyltransferase